MESGSTSSDWFPLIRHFTGDHNAADSTGKSHRHLSLTLYVRHKTQHKILEDLCQLSSRIKKNQRIWDVVIYIEVFIKLILALYVANSPLYV